MGGEKDLRERTLEGEAWGEKLREQELGKQELGEE